MLSQIARIEEIERERLSRKTLSINKYVDLFKQKYDSDKLILLIKIKNLFKNKFGYLAKIEGISDGTTELQDDIEFRKHFNDNQADYSTIFLSDNKVKEIKQLHKKSVFLFIDTNITKIDKEGIVSKYHKTIIKSL